MPLYNVEAINIRSKGFGEADKLITLFTRQQGKFQAIAKGARKTSSKFGGRLELFTYNQLLLATGKSLDIISQCETIESFYKLREDQEKLAAGLYIIKLIDIILFDRHKDVRLFNLLLETLQNIQRSENLILDVRAFEVRLCDAEGLLPSKEMLERKFKKLPFIVSVLLNYKNENLSNISDKDLDVSGKIFKEIISEHAGIDIRRLNLAI